MHLIESWIALAFDGLCSITSAVTTDSFFIWVPCRVRTKAQSTLACRFLHTFTSCVQKAELVEFKPVSRNGDIPQAGKGQVQT